jgi:hypothetical protein
MWLADSSGTSRVTASIFAAATPTSSADQSRSIEHDDGRQFGPADVGSLRRLIDHGQEPLQMSTGGNLGTTPPKRACRSVCDATTLDSTAGHR